VPEVFGWLTGRSKCPAARRSAWRSRIKEPTFCFADEPMGALDWAHGRSVVRMDDGRIGEAPGNVTA
jgi:hypothetical protein